MGLGFKGGSRVVCRFRGEGFGLEGLRVRASLTFRFGIVILHSPGVRLEWVRWGGARRPLQGGVLEPCSRLGEATAEIRATAGHQRHLSNKGHRLDALRGCNKNELLKKTLPLPAFR